MLSATLVKGPYVVSLDNLCTSHGGATTTANKVKA